MSRETDEWLERVEDAYPDEAQLRAIGDQARDALGDDAPLVVGRVEEYLADLARGRGEPEMDEPLSDDEVVEAAEPV